LESAIVTKPKKNLSLKKIVLMPKTPTVGEKISAQSFHRYKFARLIT